MLILPVSVLVHGMTYLHAPIMQHMHNSPTDRQKIIHKQLVYQFTTSTSVYWTACWKNTSLQVAYRYFLCSFSISYISDTSLSINCVGYNLCSTGEGGGGKYLISGIKQTYDTDKRNKIYSNFMTGASWNAYSNQSSCDIICIFHRPGFLLHHMILICFTSVFIPQTYYHIMPNKRAGCRRQK